MIRKSFVMSLVGAIAMALAGTAQAQDRVSASQKGSLLIFSKVEIKWSADGSQLLQDTFVDFSNDYPADVDVQAYFINGDLELEQKCSGEPCEDNIIQEFEPGWNTADCKFSLTGDQPHYWSAARGSDLCQAFTVLDTEGPGRPDPETGMATRILRGYVIMWAVKFTPGAPDDLGTFLPIRWNHLKGDALIINYANGTAWEYNAWAFQANGTHGQPIASITDGEITLPLNGTVYSTPFDTLLLDFYGTGSTALSGGDQTVMTDTDLTVHAVSADLRQDGCGPVLTKIEAEIWNEFETKFSGTRRCICCWDQTMLSNWVRSVSIPNHFKRSALRTDKGKARLDGIASDECDRGADDGHDYVSGYELYCGPTAKSKRRHCDDTAGQNDESEDAAILGLATKFLSFSPSGDQATAGMNLVGAGEESAEIIVDAQIGPDELNSIDRDGRAGVKTSGAKGVSTDRGATVRDAVEVPAE